MFHTILQKYLIFYFMLLQEVATVTPEEDGSVEVEIGKDGTTVTIVFEEVDGETVSVGPVEVKACAKPGKK